MTTQVVNVIGAGLAGSEAATKLQNVVSKLDYMK